MKRTVFCAICAALCIFSAAAADSQKIKDGFNTFLDDLNRTLPDSAANTGTWSDAYIGQLFALPPHLGIGVSGGVTKLSMGGINTVFNELNGKDLYPKSSFVLPSAAIEARLGGIFLPFDIGFKILPVKYNLKAAGDLSSALSIDYLMWGADIRFALIKEKVIIPAVSVGAGYTYIGGKLGAEFSAAEFGSAKSEVEFKSHTADIQLQVSKKIFFLRPYAGVKLLMSGTESRWTMGSESGTAKTGFTFGTQVYGGLGVDIFVVKLDFGASYNVVNQIWGVKGGLRVQL